MRSIRALARGLMPRPISISARGSGWLASRLAPDFKPPLLPVHRAIERRARATDAVGARPLWSGYRAVENYPRSVDGARRPNDVRCSPEMGRFFSWLAASRASDRIVEIGTAFGVSGMYWLAGLKPGGRLYAFEPNADWAAFARDNLAAVSSAFTLQVATFEEAGPSVIEPGSVDIAFIDAIHTSAFVRSQYALVRPLLRQGALVLFDDIAFSADMAEGWREIASDPTLQGVAEISGRLGIIEIP